LEGEIVSPQTDVGGFRRLAQQELVEVQEKKISRRVVTLITVMQATDIG